MRNKKHERTLETIFKNPVQSNVVWKDIESLMRHLETEITEGEGSRVRFALNGIRATFHRPHPKKRKPIKGLSFSTSIFRKCGSKTMMKYKSYAGHVEYDDEVKIFHGEVLGIKMSSLFKVQL